MPRRSILSATERESLFALPDSTDELIRLYTLNDNDLSIISQRRGAANRLGFAVQLCYMRYPGVIVNDTLKLIHFPRSMFKKRGVKVSHC